MEFRSITDLEQLTTLPDDAQILIIDNNTAKRISKNDAKFGGGAMVVTFTLIDTDFSADKTVEEVTKAMTSMPVIGNINIHKRGSVVTFPLGACCSEINNSVIVPAFGPFVYKSSGSAEIVGFVGVDNNGQWEVRRA